MGRGGISHRGPKTALFGLCFLCSRVQTVLTSPGSQLSVTSGKDHRVLSLPGHPERTGRRRDQELDPSAAGLHAGARGPSSLLPRAVLQPPTPTSTTPPSPPSSSSVITPATRRAMAQPPKSGGCKVVCVGSLWGGRALASCWPGELDLWGGWIPHPLWRKLLGDC